MASFRLLLFFFSVAFMGSSPAVAQDAAAVSGAVSGLVRQPRSHANRLCRKYGICNGGYQGGYQGYQQGYQGYQQPYPPINIAISQSQSSANEAGGGYSNGYYPNNYQFNGGYQKYPNYQRPGGYFGNGHGAFNNQFNGNYYGPSLGQQGGGGYGFGGGYFDESPDDNAHRTNQDDGPGTGPGGANGPDGPGGPSGPGGYSDYQGRNNGNKIAVAAFALAGREN